MFASAYGNNEPNLFGGGTQFGGAGGFVPSQNAEPTQAIKGKFHQQTLRAVTVKQIQDAIGNVPDDNVVIDGQPLSNITLVGKIISLRETETYFDMQLDDGTGVLEVKLYVDSDADTLARKRRDCEPNRYVTVHGHLRPMDNNHPVNAFNVRQISDFNEVPFHFLSCIYQHSYFTKGPGGNSGAAPSSAAKLVGGAPRGLGSEASPILEAVKNAYLSAPGTSRSIQEITDSFGGRFSVQQVREAANALTSEGSMFMVSDDLYQAC